MTEQRAAAVLAYELKRLGAQVEFWKRRGAPASREVQQIRLLRAALALWGDEPRLLGEPLRKLREDRGHLIQRVDELTAKLKEADKCASGGDIARALNLWQEAVDEAPWPSIQVELGALMLHRCRVEPSPLCAGDLQTIHVDTDIFGWATPYELLPGPDLHQKARPAHVALDAYARAYGYYSAAGLETDPDNADTQIVVWQLFILDGLRLIGLELREWRLTDLACNVYDDLLPDASVYYEDGVLLERRFAETRGYLRGRQVEAAVEEAVDAVRRATAVSDPDSFADLVADSVVARLAAVPESNRREIEASLATSLSDWQHVPNTAKQTLISAEYTRHATEAGAWDFSAPCVLYGKAVEAALRAVTGGQGSTIDKFVATTGGLSLLRGSLKPAAPVDGLLEVIGNVKDLRNRAAHAVEPYVPIKKEEMSSLREWTLWVVDTLVKHRR